MQDGDGLEPSEPPHTTPNVKNDKDSEENKQNEIDLIRLDKVHSQEDHMEMDEGVSINDIPDMPKTPHNVLSTDYKSRLTRNAKSSMKYRRTYNYQAKDIIYNL